MECRYCRALNAEDDHRCQRCGRRLRMTPVYTGASAAAPELRFEAEPQAQPPEPAPAAPVEAARPRRAAYQPSLFGARELPKVVAFEDFAPAAVEPAPAKSHASRPRAKRPVPGQQSLDFAQAGRPQRASRTDVEPVIYCDDPVAIPAHRMMAAAMDAALVAVGMGLFLGTFYFAGGELPLNKVTLPMFGAAAALLAILYHALWSLGDGDTAGMRWAHLRLVNFEGRPPTREQRFYRLASECLSVLAAGLGLLWALVDEEALTWHDHISKTFPTTY